MMIFWLSDSCVVIKLIFILKQEFTEIVYLLDYGWIYFVNFNVRFLHYPMDDLVLYDFHGFIQ